MENATGAGLIIYFDNRSYSYKELPKDIVYLILQTNGNKFDFPKGCIDENESVLLCAIRETFEECSLINNKHYEIDKNNFIMSSGGLVMYLAKFLPKNYLSFKDLPKVQKNPHTKIFEHQEEILWLTKTEIIKSKKLLKYLIKYIEWSSIAID